MNENLKFVPKKINPPNVPQTRSIENLWVFLAQKVYEEGCEAKTEEQLIRRIQSKMKEFYKKNCGEPFEGLWEKSNR